MWLAVTCTVTCSAARSGGERMLRPCKVATPAREARLPAATYSMDCLALIRSELADALQFLVGEVCLFLFADALDVAQAR